MCSRNFGDALQRLGRYKQLTCPEEIRVRRTDQERGERCPGLNSKPEHVKRVVEGMLKRHELQDCAARTR
jgi:hypothetical protein